jgi:high-affinity nickel-transport protein
MAWKSPVTTMTLLVRCPSTLKIWRRTNIEPGGAICGSFVVFGVGSAILYRPWRKRVDAKRNALMRPYEEELDDLGESHGHPEIIQEISAPQGHTDRKGDVVV